MLGGQQESLLEHDDYIIHSIYEMIELIIDLYVITAALVSDSSAEGACECSHSHTNRKPFIRCHHSVKS